MATATSIRSQTRVVNADGSVTETVVGLQRQRLAEGPDRHDHQRERTVGDDAGGHSTATAHSMRDPDRCHGSECGRQPHRDGQRPQRGRLACATRTVVTTSATGLSRTTQWDVNGDGVFDATRTDVTVLNADGSRTETVHRSQQQRLIESPDRHDDERQRPVGDDAARYRRLRQLRADPDRRHGAQC